MFEDAAESAQGSITKRLVVGQQVEGTILEISAGLIVLDIGSSADATLDLNELTDQAVKPGDRIKATVKDASSDCPVLTIALGKDGGTLNVESLKLALSSSTPVSGQVTAAVKGGFTVDVAGVRAFCPISQIDHTYVTEPEAYVGQSLEFLVTEVREGGRNVVISRRKLLDTTRKETEATLAKELNIGSEIAGTVKATLKHGAVIDIGGADGFAHISQLSRSRVERTEDAVSVGDKVQAQVLSIEQGEKGVSIRLSLKALEKAPDQAKTDEILEGKVVRHTNNGVIVGTKIGEGMVPVRELSLAPGADHRRSLPVGHELRVVVVHNDNSGKLRLSVSRVAQVEERSNYRSFSKDKPAAGNFGSLGDLLTKKFGSQLAAQATSPIPKAPVAKKPAAAKPAAPKPAAPKPVESASNSTESPADKKLNPAAKHTHRRKK